MQTIYKWAPVFFVIVGVGIFAYRYKLTRQCHFLCYKETKFVINEKNFLDSLQSLDIKPESAYHLFVFLDPAIDCPSCLMEADRWVGPAHSTTNLGWYDYSLIMGSNTNLDARKAFLDTFGIEEDKLIIVGSGHDLLEFHKYGVLKVLVGQNKIVWYEFGSKSEPEYDKFSERLSETVKKPS